MLGMLRKALCLILLLAFSSVSAVKKEPYCEWDEGISTRFIKKVDKRLLTGKRKGAREIIRESLPFELPTPNVESNNEQVLVQPNYIIWYDSDLRSPLWVAYHLKGSDVRDGVPREESFRSDPRLKYWEKSDCADYKEPIFDQGHMVPSADMKRSREAMASTYLMSNMTAQHCQFNRGQWQVLEAVVRNWAERYGEIWVISGAIYDRYGEDERDPDQIAWRMSGERGVRVAIPSHQYKIVMRKDETGLLGVAFLMPNEDRVVRTEDMREYLGNASVDIETVVSRSGFDFGKGKKIREDGEEWLLPINLPSPLTRLCNKGYPKY